MLTNIPNTTLLGIVLTVTSHSGPQLVYHYPPNAVKVSPNAVKVSSKATDSTHKNSNNNNNNNESNENLTEDNGLNTDFIMSDDDISVYNDSDYEYNLELDEQNGEISEIRKNTEHDTTDQSTLSRSVSLNKSSSIKNNNTPTSDSPMHSADHYQTLLKKQTRGSLPEQQDFDSHEAAHDFDNAFDESGLSDSELSTDYADYSDSSSSLSSMDDTSVSRMSRSSSTDLLSPTLSDSPSLISPYVGSGPHLYTGNNDESINKDQNASYKSHHHISAKNIFKVLNQPVSVSVATSIDKNFDAESKVRSIATPTSNIQSKLPEHVKEFISLINKKYPSDQFTLDSKIQGYDPEFLAEFCCPPKELCNTRFEFTADELCFLGLPIHANDDGSWRQKSKKSKKRSKKRGTSIVSESIPPGGAGTNETTAAEKASGDNYKERCENTYTVTEDGASELGITMFNLVFIMNPELVEFDDRTDDMFHYIISRYSLFLKYLQSKTNFVSKEAYKILKIKERYQNYSKQSLYKKILASSSLARSITQCFEKLVNNEIANLVIDEDKFISLQIPIKNEFSNFPNYKISPVLNGSYLSSILNKSFLQKNIQDSGNSNTGMATTLKLTSSDDNDGDVSLPDNLDIESLDLLNHALLFTKDQAEIISELKATSGENDLTTIIMISLVKNLKPTLPLRAYKHIISDIILSASNDEDIADDEITSSKFCLNMLKSFALHFMYWRHARAIIPLSLKNTYIISPLAPIKGTSADDFDPNIEYENLDIPPLVYQNAENFRERFPTLPKLPTFLSFILNSGSGPKPFGMFIPSADHKNIYLTALSWLLRKGYVTQLLTFVYLRVDNKIKIAVEEDLEKEGLLKNKKTGHHNRSTTSEKKSHGRFNYYQNSSLMDTDMHGDSEDHSDDDGRSLFSLESDDERDDFTIILEPTVATAIEKRWLYKCVEDLSPSQQILFYKLLKYFNGKVPMEYVVIKENISRNDVNKLFASLGKYLIELKHW